MASSQAGATASTKAATSLGDNMVLQPGVVLCLEGTNRKDGYLGDFEETVVVMEDGCAKSTDANVRWWRTNFQSLGSCHHLR